MDPAVIVVDARIPAAVEAFSGLGDVRPFDGTPDPSDLADARVLVVRSSTRVDAALLDACPRLEVLATPVVGTDHVDRAALAAFRARTGRPVPLFHAPGSTAGGVADFALACLDHLARCAGRDLRDLVVGIWGLGKCGGALAVRLDRLGVRHVDHDPPLQARSHGAFRSAPVEAITSCDAVSLHVPLTRPADSPWPTFRMIGTRELAGPRFLVNTARGAVVDPVALARAIDSGRLLAAVDVWEHEPEPDPSLVGRCTIATPHVAGSVYEGRLRAIAMVRESVRAALSLPAVPWHPVPPPGRATGLPDVAALSAAFRREYLAAAPGERGRVFERIRASAMRHEVTW